MNIFEIQREIQAAEVMGIETMPVMYVNEDGEAVPVTVARIEYDKDGFPYILLDG